MTLKEAFQMGWEAHRRKVLADTLGHPFQTAEEAWTAAQGMPKKAEKKFRVTARTSSNKSSETK